MSLRVLEGVAGETSRGRFAPLPTVCPEPSARESNGEASSEARLLSSRTLMSGRLSPEPSLVERVDLDIVQFSAPLYFVEQEEESISIDIMRMGSLTGQVSVKYRTENGSGIAGEIYEHVEGEVTFEDGEYIKTIDVKTINNGKWACTLEFKLKVYEADNCQLGKYLHTSRVKVINNQYFPSSKFEEAIKAFKIKDMSAPALFREYFILNFSAGQVAWSTIVTLLMEQLKNLYVLITIWSSMYLVNTVLNTDDETEHLLFFPSRKKTAYFICFLHIGPFAVLHIWAACKLRLDIAGESTSFLQVNLFRKFLNYTEDSREKVGPTRIVNAIAQDADELGKGYEASLNLVTVIGKILINVIFVLWKNPSAAWVVVLLPTLMLTWALCREEYVVRIPGHTKQLIAVVDHVVDSANNFELIADYFQRPLVNDMMEEKVQKLKKSSIPKKEFRLHTSQVLQWFSPFFIAIYIVVACDGVLAGDTSLGAFLATISVIKQICGDTVEGYSDYQKVTSSFACLYRLTHFLNCETELKREKATNRVRRQRTREAIQQVRTSGAADAELMKAKYKVDMLQFKVDSLFYTSYAKEGGNAMPFHILKDVNIAARQGEAVAITGEHKSGKALFLRLLSNRAQATEGHVFIPTHLRCLHVSMQPMLMPVSPYRNLIFGLGKSELTVDEVKRVEQICQLLEMHKVLEMISPDLKAAMLGESIPGADSGRTSWMKKLTGVEQTQLHVARCLIMNPEVLMMQRPLTMYDSGTGKLVLQALLLHVRQRGLFLPEESLVNRRPRSLFYSTVSLNDIPEMDGPDRIWRMTPCGKDPLPVHVQEVTREELQRLRG
eukprot:TRINITY_DN14630_c0_g1_i2.p1 TRINITY_DN14630_c0_g1~~TRINITY_DN14630_c0_g1_i2.p1  ORF type:complete len:834 (-),score=143.75 TRINITY_DN14630_c0_g1_i2:463-2964(-)